MRLLLTAALLLSAAPALAQDAPERDRDDSPFVIEVDSLLTNGLRLKIERGDDGSFLFRHGDGADDVVRLRLPDAEAVRGLHDHRDLLSLWNSRGAYPLLGGLAADPDVTAETRQRMRELEEEARTAARRARGAEGPERREAERRLDATLGELFDARGQARREKADALRERARELESRAAELEDAVEDRADRRQALIESRRAELLGESTSDW